MSSAAHTRAEKPNDATPGVITELAGHRPIGRSANGARMTSMYVTQSVHGSSTHAPWPV